MRRKRAQLKGVEANKDTGTLKRGRRAKKGKAKKKPTKKVVERPPEEVDELDDDDDDMDVDDRDGREESDSDDDERSKAHSNQHRALTELFPTLGIDRQFLEEEGLDFIDLRSLGRLMKFATSLLDIIFFLTSLF
jgi:hypothetical protein